MLERTSLFTQKSVIELCCVKSTYDEALQIQIDGLLSQESS